MSASGATIYAYVGGNPVNGTDSQGLFLDEAGQYLNQATRVGVGIGTSVASGVGLFLTPSAIGEELPIPPIPDPAAQPEDNNPTSSDTKECPKDDDDCKRLGKQAKAQAKNVLEHIENWHFHSKPCINLKQTLSEAANKCDLSQPNFSSSIRIFNQVCTDPYWFPPPYAKPQGPPFQPF